MHFTHCMWLNLIGHNPINKNTSVKSAWIYNHQKKQIMMEENDHNSFAKQDSKLISPLVGLIERCSVVWKHVWQWWSSFKHYKKH